MEKLRQKHVGRNIILGSQKQSEMTFNVDTSQQKHHVTTSDTKAELVAITMKPCEMCHSMVDLYWFNMHCQLVLIWVEFAFNSVSMISKEISLCSFTNSSVLNVSVQSAEKNKRILFLCVKTHGNMTPLFCCSFSPVWFLFLFSLVCNWCAIALYLYEVKK